MTSREIVSRAIHFRNPPRLPVTMGSIGIDDTGWVGANAPAGWKPPAAGVDEWGCIWERTETRNGGQVKGHPLADISRLSKYRPPDYSDPSRYAHIAPVLDEMEAQGRYILSSISTVLFERMHMLHGFEDTLVDLYTDRHAMEDLADMIVEAHVTLVHEISRRCPGRINGWYVTDDWGTQTAAFISFDLWMDFFFSRYKRIFDTMHEAGCDVWVHSCGKVNEIIEGYILAGVNVVNLQQPRALGIEEIGKRYRGRIAFQGLADIQATLPTGNRGQVAEDVELLMKHWAKPEGGFIFSEYPDDVGIGLKDQSIKRFMYDEFSRRSQAMYGEGLPLIPRLVTSWQVSRIMPKGTGIADATCVTLKDNLEWTRFDAGSFVDLHTGLFGDKDGLVYLANRFRASKSGEWDLSLGHDGGVRVFIDGKCLMTVPQLRNPAFPGRSCVRARLAQGEHEVAIAFDLAAGFGWGIFFSWNVQGGKLESGIDAAVPELVER
jgi:uroporphyrinogen decarboxylase